jgi:hypothetical protein
MEFLFSENVLLAPIKYAYAELGAVVLALKT